MPFGQAEKRRQQSEIAGGVFEMKEIILKTIIEGLGLGVLLVLVCAVGIRGGAVGMVHLYSREV